MNYYPGHPDGGYSSTFQQSRESSYTVSSKINISYTSLGTPRLSDLTASRSREFNVVHIVSGIDKNTLLDFYNNNKKVPFYFYYYPDGTTYAACMFKSPPSIQIYSPDASLFKVTCNIIEV